MPERILLLRATEGEDAGHGEDVDVLVTHEIAPLAAGIAEAAGFAPEGATLVVSSQTTVRILHDAGEARLFAAPFAQVRAVGAESARTLEAHGASGVLVAAQPGAAGLLAEIGEELSGVRILWPHGSDADATPLAELARRGALVTAPVVYEKKPKKLDAEILKRLRTGGYAGVGVTSLAALDVLLDSLAALPKVRWGVIGPETARHFSTRGLPPPVVPNRAKIADLIAALRRKP
jgi:uroporphyrinogen-III synthase